MKLYSKIIPIVPLVIVFLLQFGCTNTEYIIDEPIIGDSTNSPGGFTVSVSSVTDTKVLLNWAIPNNTDNDLTSFEIGVNDSIVVYDLSVNTSSYMVEDLIPDTEYEFTVVATGQDFQKTMATVTTQTLKSLLKGIISYDLGYEDCYFQIALKTSDGGYIVEGYGTINTYSTSPHDFLLKINADHSIEWYREYEEWYSSLTYSPRSLLECPDGSFLLTQNRALTKISPKGDIMWIFEVPEEYKIACLVSSAVDSNGDFIVVGNSDRNWPNGPIFIEYFLLKVSSHGVEQWHRYGGESAVSDPQKIYYFDQTILVLGTAESTGSHSYADNHEWTNNFWRLELDQNGEKVSQRIYPNEFEVEDLTQDAYIRDDGTIIFLGAYGGYLPPNGYYNTYPRALKIDKFGDIVWDETPKLADYYVFSSFDAYDEASNGDLLVLGTDDRGVSLNRVNSDGSASEIISLRGYSNMLSIKEDLLQNTYELISPNGYIIILNRDGYISNN